VRCRLDFINASWTPYHAVEEASQRLMAAGFTHIAEKDAWTLKPGAASNVTAAARAVWALEPDVAKRCMTDWRLSFKGVNTSSRAS
jgi:aspartyl aminopeptidase